MQPNTPMENKPINDKEVLLNTLNNLAEAFEKNEIPTANFEAHCNGLIELAAVMNTIDLIEKRLLQEQVTDIKNLEYTRFCDPEDLMPPKTACGYDHPNNDIALEK